MLVIGLAVLALSAAVARRITREIALT
jgi:hypothetical protein